MCVHMYVLYNPNARIQYLHRTNLMERTQKKVSVNVIHAYTQSHALLFCTYNCEFLVIKHLIIKQYFIRNRRGTTIYDGMHLISSVFFTEC